MKIASVKDIIALFVIALAAMVYADVKKIGYFDSAVEGIDYVNTENYANKRLEFYYYLPKKILGDKEKKYPVLAMITGLGGRGENFVTPEFKKFAEEKNFIIIAPSFVWDTDNWNSQTSYQYPAAWSGDAFLKIVEKLENSRRVSVSSLNFFGFSAGAQFSLRFCVWRPELCAVSIAHAAGGSVIPDKKSGVKFFVTVGTEDKDRIGFAENFYTAAQALGMDVKFKKYVTGHSLIQDQINDSLDFLRSVYR